MEALTHEREYTVKTNPLTEAMDLLRDAQPVRDHAEWQRRYLALTSTVMDVIEPKADIREGAMLGVSTPKHTPGPWICNVVRISRTRQIQVRSKEGVVAHVIVPRCIKGKLHTDVACINGKLLARAPRMREALLQVIEFAECGELPPASWIDDWRQILVAARGEEDIS